MKRVALKVAALVGVVSSCALLGTTELRTPLSLVKSFGPFHYPLKEENNDGCWSWDVFNALYGRSADVGFGPSGNANGDSHRFGSRQTITLAQLFFGADSFTIGQSFAGGNGVVVGNPAVTVSLITPDFSYSEKGWIIGGHIERHFGCDDQWRFGGRAVLPFKLISVDRNLACAPLEESLEGVVQQLTENVDNTGNQREVYIYRLDFLTALRTPNPTGTPAQQVSEVNYANPADLNHITIGGEDITTGPGAGTGNSGAPTDFTTAPLYAVRSVDGTIGSILSSLNGPDGYNTIARPVAPAGNLAADGSGGGNGARMAFDGGTNYTPLMNNLVAQRQLFIIPNSNGAGNLRTTASAVGQRIMQDLSMLIQNPNATAIDFLLSKGIDICDRQRAVGFGDLDTDIFVGYDWCDLYAELYLGIRWPTGKKNENPGHVYYQTTGNNGHFEFKVELDGGWNPCRWFGLEADASYSYAFKREEKKAAAFKGATIINIGPSIDARVSYGYFVGHVNLTFFHPENCNLGMVLGYELYAKQSDKVSFEGTTFNDLNGVSQTLDANLLHKNTNALSHKIRGEVFHRWDSCEIFGGASRVFAGKNVMKETEAHIGLGIFF